MSVPINTSDMLICESILDNVEQGRVDVRTAGSESADDTMSFDQEFAWTFASLNQSVPQHMLYNFGKKFCYLLDAYDVPYSIGVFSEENYDELPEGVRVCGRLDIMSAALVIMYTPVSRKSVKLPLLMGAIMYEAIMSCPYIDTTNDDDHYSLWQL